MSLRNFSTRPVDLDWKLLWYLGCVCWGYAWYQTGWKLQSPGWQLNVWPPLKPHPLLRLASLFLETTLWQIICSTRLKIKPMASYAGTCVSVLVPPVQLVLWYSVRNEEEDSAGVKIGLWKGDNWLKKKRRWKSINWVFSVDLFRANETTDGESLWGFMMAEHISLNNTKVIF